MAEIVDEFHAELNSEETKHGRPPLPKLAVERGVGDADADGKKWAKAKKT